MMRSSKGVVAVLDMCMLFVVSSGFALVAIDAGHEGVLVE